MDCGGILKELKVYQFAVVYTDKDKGGDKANDLEPVTSLKCVS